MDRVVAPQGIPERVNKEVFIAMSKSLNFIGPDEISATILLTGIASSRKKMAPRWLFWMVPTERLCQPMVDYISDRGEKSG